jgi:hypothetical protein
MDEGRDTRPVLRLLRGGLDGITVGGVRVVVARASRPPFPVDAVVVEDDTWFVLGVDPEIDETPSHPVRLWTALHALEPVSPGSVHVRRGRPLRLHAVVHDVALEPTWREEWVALALEACLVEADRLGVRALRLPVLGAVHGRLHARRFAALLRGALGAAEGRSLERVWVVAPEGLRTDLEEAIDASPTSATR